MMKQSAVLVGDRAITKVGEMWSIPKQPSSRVFGACRLLFVQVAENRVGSHALKQHWWESWRGALNDSIWCSLEVLLLQPWRNKR